MKTRITTLGVVLVVTLLAAARPAAPAPTPQQVLDFCLANPSACSLSVRHLTQGWERHWNADRLQPLASVVKVVTLITYAEAVADGRLDPGRVVTRDDWARFWLEGDALLRAWTRLGQPPTLTVDEIVGAMIRESDNASADWLLDTLGQHAFKRVIRRYIDGYHDLPESLGVFVGHLLGTPAEPGIGNRIAQEYSGFEVAGYREEADDLFARLHDPAFVDDVKRFHCFAVPWEAVPQPCSRVFPTSIESYGTLATYHSARSNTRSHSRLLAGILGGDLLPPTVSEIVRRHLEWRLELPEYAARFTRHGGKSGSIPAINNDVRNWTAYMEGRDGGDRFVVSIFLRRLPTGFITSTADDLGRFAEAILLDPGFATAVRDSIPVVPPAPELVPQLTALRHGARAADDTLLVKVRVTNVGTAAAEGPFTVSLFLSDDNQLDAGDALLRAVHLRSVEPTKERTKRLGARGLGPIDGKYAIVAVDAANTVAEGVEDNNVAWQRVR
jgi:hypothetical protein